VIKTKNKNIIILFTILLDGLVVVALDLFMDPIAVKSGDWTWLEGGPYFGIPIGNFIGWFFVVVLAMGTFRAVEYFFPRKEIKYNKSIYNEIYTKPINSSFYFNLCFSYIIVL
jgi:putative membrane protein